MTTPRLLPLLDIVAGVHRDTALSVSFEYDGQIMELTGNPPSWWTNAYNQGHAHVSGVLEFAVQETAVTPTPDASGRIRYDIPNARVTSTVQPGITETVRGTLSIEIRPNENPPVMTWSIGWLRFEFSFAQDTSGPNWFSSCLPLVTEMDLLFRADGWGGGCDKMVSLWRTNSRRPDAPTGVVVERA